MGGLGNRELPFEVDGVIWEDAVQSEEAVPTGDQEAGVSGLPVDPGTVGDTGHATVGGDHHSVGGGGAGGGE